MAGQPITRKYMTHLESVNKKNPIDERILMALSEHYSFNQIINNKVPYLKDFVREGKTTLTWSIWNKWIDKPRKQENGITFREKVTQARELANQERAFSLSEEAITIADDCDSDNPTAVNKARLQVDARKWLSGSLNTQFKSGSSNQVNIQLNTNDLHLNALKTLKE